MTFFFQTNTISYTEKWPGSSELYNSSDWGLRFHRRQSLFAESRRRSIISSSVLKSHVSKINRSQFSVLKTRKPLQPILDSRTRNALTSTLHARSVYQLLCSCSSSDLFHTNSICECVIVNYNYNTGIS